MKLSGNLPLLTSVCKGFTRIKVPSPETGSRRYSRASYARTILGCSNLPHCLNFPQEIIVEQGAVLLVSTNDFDGNFAFQSRVNRFVDFTHSTWSNQPLKFILPDPARGREQGRLLGELIRLWCQPGFRSSATCRSIPSCTERHYLPLQRHQASLECKPTLQRPDSAA